MFLKMDFFALYLEGNTAAAKWKINDFIFASLLIFEITLRTPLESIIIF